MQIFLAENRTKSGPFSIWDVRARLDAGSLSPETLGWHEGCESWMPLHELPGLSWRRESSGPDDDRSGSPDPTLDSPLADPSPASDQSPPQGFPPLDARARPVSRWAARFFDQMLGTVIMVAITRLSGMSLETFLFSPMPKSFFLLGLLVAEAFLLHRFGTTPGKAILGLHVTGAADGSPPGPQVALRRCGFVFVLGNALSILPLNLIAWGIHAYLLLSRGRTWWDAHLGTEVVRRTPKGGVVGYILLSLSLLFTMHLMVGDELVVLVEKQMQSAQPPASRH